MCKAKSKVAVENSIATFFIGKLEYNSEKRGHYKMVEKSPRVEYEMM